MARLYQVIYAKEANEDIDKILHYLNTNHGQRAAKQKLGELLAKVEEIPLHPKSFSLYLPERKTFKRQYRYAIAGRSYRIVFAILIKGRTIRIISVRHVKMDDGPVIMRLKKNSRPVK